jgi:hypothetical protein
MYLLLRAAYSDNKTLYFVRICHRVFLCPHLKSLILIFLSVFLELITATENYV